MDNECHNIDVLVQNLETTLHDTLEVHVPLITKSVTFRHTWPWFSSTIKQQKRIVRQHERIWQKYKEDHQWHAYRTEKKKYNTILKEAKKNSISEKIDACNRNTKWLFKLVSELTSSVKDNPLPKGKSKKELAGEFVDFFLSKIQHIHDDLEGFEKFSPQQCQSTSKFSSFTAMTESEVAKVIKGMASKSCEIDPIRTTLLKDILPFIIKPITNIINISMQFGVFAKTWKVVAIKPLLKKIGLDLIPQNYCPVSNLSFLSKVSGRCVLNQFDQHCNKYGLMPEYQSAYRKNFSCETALVKIINDYLWNMENQWVTSIVTIDLSATFDRVDHQILIDVLKKRFNIEGVALKWFANYLTSRSCKAMVEDVHSTEKPLLFSVPQGSVAGPVLYNAYASTLKEVVSSSIELHGFAEDHMIKDSFKPNTDQESRGIQTFEKCTSNIKDWMDVNQLCVNSAKTEFLLVGSRKQLSHSVSTEINVNGEVVKYSECIRYLGACVDEN